MLMSGNKRNSNFELLRIISMFFIVSGHLTVQSGILDTDSKNKIYALVFGSGYGIADNIFIMIASYYLCMMEFRPKRIIKIYYELFIFCYPVTIIMTLFF